MKKVIGFYRKCDLLTMTGTLFAFIGILLAVKNHFTFSAFCLLICGICDGFDGKLARSKKYSKEEKIYGVQLDSLSDIICFGVFPTILTSLICNNTFVYIISAIYMLCAVIRLAYFNMLNAMPKSKKGIFIGAPTTTVSIIYPILLFIVRFINYEALKIVMPIILLLLGISFILRIEIKKIDVVVLLNKIFNKYVVNFVVFPIFVVVFSDLFFKMNDFGGKIYVDIFTSISYHFLTFLFITSLISLLMLLLTSIFKSSKIAKIVILIAMVIFLFINDIKYSIMGVPIQLSDINYLNPDNMTMMGTAATTLGLWIIRVIIKCLSLCLIGFLFIKLDKFHNFKNDSKVSKICCGIGSTLLILLAFLYIPKINNFILKDIYNLETEDISSIVDINEMYYNYGLYQGIYLDNLGKKFLKPDSYSIYNAKLAIKTAADYYQMGNWGKANVVVLLSESFYDPQTLEEIEFDKELMPNLKRYEKDHDKLVFDLLVNPFGGYSVNSEFEVLTGGSLAFFNNEFIPYTQYYIDEYQNNHLGLINEFNNNGYETMYLTPWGDTSYRSRQVYTTFEADKLIYGDQLKGNMKGYYYSDDSLMDDIYNELKNTKKGEYKFIMSASAQNHWMFGADKYKTDEYEVQVKKSSLPEEDTLMLRTYAQGIYDADKALNKLYKKIKTLDTPTIIVFFGDHLPNLTNSSAVNEHMKTTYFNTDNEDLNDIRKHTTKGAILANFALDTSDNLEYINSSYLGAYLLNKMDLEISDYFKFIDYTRKIVPVFNKKVIYDYKSNKTIPIRELNKVKKQALNNYRFVQYYKFYDTEFVK